MPRVDEWLEQVDEVLQAQDEAPSDDGLGNVMSALADPFGDSCNGKVRAAQCEKQDVDGISFALQLPKPGGERAA